MPAPAAPGERSVARPPRGRLRPGSALRSPSSSDRWRTMSRPGHHRRSHARVPGAHGRHVDLGRARRPAGLDAVVRLHGRPRAIVSDNGTEFAGRPLDQWAYLNHVELDLSRPERPSDDGHIEAFVGRLRVECLDACWGLAMADARERIDEWKERCNAGLARGPGRVDPAGVSAGSRTSPTDRMAPGPDPGACPIAASAVIPDGFVLSGQANAPSEPSASGRPLCLAFRTSLFPRGWTSEN